jgi:hypothetical protein
MAITNHLATDFWLLSGMAGSFTSSSISLADEGGVKRLAGDLAEMGCDIVTGGGPGLMQAANEGAAERGAPGLSWPAPKTWTFRIAWITRTRPSPSSAITTRSGNRGASARHQPDQNTSSELQSTARFRF